MTSGSHPLHQYHAWIGAKGLLEKGNSSAFDPAFHAGYIKTPLFDSQCVSVEWMAAIRSLILGHCAPPTLNEMVKVHAWYMGGIVFGMPLLVATASRFAGLGRMEAFFSAASVEMVMATPAGTRAMIDGEMGQLLAPACCVLFIGALIGYHRRPLPASAMGICFSYWMLWSTSVGTALMSTAMLLYYYLRAGLRHESWWHFVLICGLLLALLGNLGLFVAWRNHWWIQATILDESAFGPGVAMMRIADDARWGGVAGLLAGGFMIFSGLAGSQWLVWSGRRLAGRMVATVMGIHVLMFALARTVHLLAPLDAVANPVAIMMVSCLGAGASLGIGRPAGKKWTGPRWLEAFPGKHAPVATTSVATIFLLSLYPSYGMTLYLNWVGASKHFTGPPVWAKTLTEKLSELPANDGRILWEDLSGDASNGWQVFLPQSLNRGLIGGLSPVARIEHQQASLRDGKLAGRNVLEWPDSELAAFIKAYRINLVVARNPDSISRWNKYPDATVASQGSIDGSEGKWVLFRLPDQPGLAIVGNAKVVHLGPDKVTLADVVPENGSVVLSLHFQRGMKVRPGRVKIERELDSHDPIPLIRLKSDEPVSRLELEWDER